MIDLNKKLAEIEELLKNYNEEAAKIGEGKAVVANKFVLVPINEYERMKEAWESSDKCW
jgi:hypothetical protein